MASHYFLRLVFKVENAVRDLPHHQGKLWQALLNGLYSPYLKAAETFADVGLSFAVADTGVLSYAPGDRFELGLAAAEEEMERLRRVIECMRHYKSRSGKLGLNVDFVLEEVSCRIGNRALREGDPLPLDAKELLPAAARLRKMGRFTLVFTSPVRVKRKVGEREKRHKYCDEAYFRKRPRRIGHLLDHIYRETEREALERRSLFGSYDLTIALAHGMWYDFVWGFEETSKTVGGFLGALAIEGTLPDDLYQKLILHQWLGFGKNRTLGFGQFVIPEIVDILPVASLEKRRSLFAQSLSPDSLKEALDRLEDKPPGAGGLTVSDLKLGGEEALQKISADVLEGRYSPRPPRLYSVKKKGGGERVIRISDTVDLLLQKSLAARLAPSIDRLLSDSSFAYREGYSRERAYAAYRKAHRSGFVYGIKADISAFFDTVDVARLFFLLSSLFPREPAILLLKQWIVLGENGGLPQGNPLSPVLSNLFLDEFDNRLSAKGLRLIRYADDFVVLFRERADFESNIALIEKTLSSMRKTSQTMRLEHPTVGID